MHQSRHIVNLVSARGTRQAVAKGVCARPSAFVVPNLAVRGEEVRAERAVATVLELMIVVRVVDDVPRPSAVNPQKTATTSRVMGMCAQA